MEMEANKLQETLLAISESTLLSSFFDIIGINYSVIDIGGNYLVQNNAAIKQISGGLANAEIIDKDTWEDCKRIMATRKREIKEELFKNKFYFSLKQPIINENNECLGIMVISLDITDKKKTETELRETQHKLDGMTLVSASTAHELRTPLAGLSIGISVIKRIVPQLLETYKLARSANLPIPQIQMKTSFPDLLNESIGAMEREIDASLIFIDMMLINLKPELKGDKTKVFSVSQCIDKALSRYPFMPDQEKLVHWKKGKAQDFKVTGDELLVIHVLFNLLKNAIYYVTKAGKGNIEIWTECGFSEDSSTHSSGYKLYFKDTGTGISPDFLPHIFDRFFSKTRHGAGVGLTFCKMVMENLGGNITCESVEGGYTLFILFFPDMP